jgi:5'-3' exonuclease
MDKVLILDTLNYIWRGVILNHKLDDPREETTEPDYTIVYAFFRNLRATIEKFAPDKVFAALEGKNNFRYKLLEGYKANRIVKFASFKTKEESDNFNRQRDIILHLIKYLPITCVYADQYEADDVIYSLTDNMRNEDITIVSNDSDLTQILQKSYKSVKIYNPFKKTYVEPPKYFSLVYKSLAGDKSDCVPGIVGPKKAAALANDPKALAEFLESNEEARIQFNDNTEIIRLRLIPSDELVFDDFSVNWFALKEEFRSMDFQSIIRSDVWHKFVDTFKSITL